MPNPLIAQNVQNLNQNLVNLGSLQGVLDGNDQTIAMLNAQLVAKNKLVSDIVAGRAMTIDDNLQDAPDGPESTATWHDAGPNLANSNPSIPAPHGKYVWDRTTGLLQWNPAAPYDNLFFYRVRPTPTSLPTLLSDTRNYSLLNQSQSQALEIDFQLSWDGLTHSMAWQFNFVKNVVSFFNFTAKQWVPAPGNIPVPDFTHNTTITAEYELAESTTIHRALTINGVIFPVNVSQAATKTGFANKFTLATQLDVNGKGQPMRININNICLRYL